MQTGLFAEQVLLRRLDKNGDPLARLDSVVDRQPLLPVVESPGAGTAWLRPDAGLSRPAHIQDCTAPVPLQSFR